MVEIFHNKIFIYLFVYLFLYLEQKEWCKPAFLGVSAPGKWYPRLALPSGVLSWENMKTQGGSCHRHE